MHTNTVKLNTYVAMLTFLVLIMMSILCDRHADARTSGRGRVSIDDQSYEVSWSDGDSFRITGGTKRGQRVRLLGYNTLESYGPVHKWSDWNEWGLYKIAKNSKALAVSETWECKSLGKVDRYKRLLVRCPKLIEAMVRTGMGHIFEIEETPSAQLIQLQAEAIKGRKGMWRRGAPEGLMTSVHSQSENPEKPSYNRVASLKTGIAAKSLHTETYKLCQWVCMSGSCMRYIPFQQRYGDKRPDCLKWKP